MLLLLLLLLRIFCSADGIGLGLGCCCMKIFAAGDGDGDDGGLACELVSTLNFGVNNILWNYIEMREKDGKKKNLKPKLCTYRKSVFKVHKNSNVVSHIKRICRLHN